MENNDNIIMSRIAFERMQAKDERNDRWRNIIIILLIILLVVTNVIWLIAWNSYDYVEEYASIDAGNGTANFVGHNGDINNGENNIQKEDEDA